jgi:DNA repair protein RadC
MPSKRYRLELATWIVVRDVEEPSPRTINQRDDAARLALEFARAADDDREHFWVVLLNTKHRYLMHTEVSVGTVKVALVRPREDSARPCARARPVFCCVITIRAVSPHLR